MRRLLFALLLITSTIASAEPRARAVRRTGNITVDGKLDEPAWKTAPKQHDFTQRQPRDGAKASLDTTFAVLYDDQAVYVGVWCDDPEPAKIKRNLTRRDVDALSDAIMIAFDSYHDKRTAFVFQLNAAGVQRDQMIFDDAGSDDTWDAVWTGDSKVNDHGWTAEFRIPLNQLRYPHAAQQEWGMQVLRLIARFNEQSTWSPWPRSGSQIVSRFGVISGIDELKPARRLELLPYVTGGAQSNVLDEGDPLTKRHSAVGNVGADLKYGLGPAFTLSATINPDFGQVEADPSQVNLSANELFFQEKRPFFLEGVDLFRIPIGDNDNEGAFYSRRIGAAPTYAPDDYQYIQSPTATTIYTAAKLTGKRHGWSVGLLDAVTGEESATIIDADGNRQEPVVAPLTNYAVGRVKRDFREGKTSVGASATAVDRDLEGSGLEGVLDEQAYTAGTQLSTTWSKNAWEAKFTTIGSLVHGSKEAITETQISQVHLFQRPDSFRLDPDRTSLYGAGYGYGIGRTGDTKHWRLGIGGSMSTPGLEVNDAGFQQNSDLIINGIFGQYHDEEPNDTFLSQVIGINIFSIATSDGLLTDLGFESFLNAQLANQWYVNAGASFYDSRWNRGALRGGAALRVDPGYFARFNVTSDGRKSVVGSIGINGYRNPATDSGNFGVNTSVQVQARSNIDVSINTGWGRNDDAMQFVEEAVDQTGKSHFVFARINQTTLTTTLRVNWTFSPRLSLQVYAQPFVATGRYREFKDVDNPGATKFRDRFGVLDGTGLMESDGVLTGSHDGVFSFDKPDFSFAQVRSNVVMRWEYRPGSSLFVIWSHGQTTDGVDGRFRLGRDLGDLAEAQTEDIVMVKANYWIGL